MTHWQRRNAPPGSGGHGRRLLAGQAEVLIAHLPHARLADGVVIARRRYRRAFCPAVLRRIAAGERVAISGRAVRYLQGTIEI